MTNPKKINVLFRHRSMEMGGVEKVLLSLLHNLDRDQFEMTVCLNINQGKLRNEIPSHVRKVILTKGREDLSKNKWRQKIQLALRNIELKKIAKKPAIAQNILKGNFDIEIATTYSMYGNVLNSVNKNSKKIAWLHSDLTLAGFDPYRAEIFRNLQQFDYVIYGSRQCKEILAEKFPEVKFPQGEVILNAIPIEELKKKAQEFPVNFGEVPTFISVGRLHFRKGYHTLLEAHKKLINDGFNHHINVIGDGEDWEKLSSRIKELEVENTFKLLGAKMNPYPYVKNADFYVMPSESEGWPLIIAETLILQKPILATNVGGIPELIEHGKTGFLVEYSIESLYDGMKEFLQNKALVQKIQDNLTTIDEKFDNQKIFNAVENVIRKLVKSEN